MGVTKLRLARFGRKDNPLFKIVAADSRSPRDSKYKEELGTYKPLADNFGTSQVTMNNDRIKYWLGVGAQPTDSVAYLLGRADILPMLPKKFRPKKQQRVAKYQEIIRESSNYKTLDKIATFTHNQHLEDLKKFNKEMRKVRKINRKIESQSNEE
eukprot:snap_masked-scaffold_7-processed-gene-11.12-mRNA-1 protein AED:0.10 eAED:0.10 QI:0/-1/0/1/-1/1/1/0/154